MQHAHRDLWRSLEAFELDDASASLTFTRRLARENGWDHTFAVRVVEEYKRFVFLAMTAGHQVTPSDEVDQAWHLHLTYTRSYWDELCGEVLGRPLHHGPTKGGQQEGDRFEDQYEQTLASYREAFGEEPPADIWPPCEIRFGEAADFVRVNRGRVWIMPKPWRGQRHAMLAVACGLTIAPTVAVVDFDLEAVGRILLFVCIAAILVAVLYSIWGGGGGSGRGRGGWFGCSGCGGGGCGGCGGD